jgi:hypothetical protein
VTLRWAAIGHELRPTHPQDQDVSALLVLISGLPCGIDIRARQGLGPAMIELDMVSSPTFSSAQRILLQLVRCLIVSDGRTEHARKGP